MSPVFDPGHGDEPTCGVCGTEMELAPHSGGVLKRFCPRCSDAADAHHAFIDHESRERLEEKD